MPDHVEESARVLCRAMPDLACSCENDLHLQNSRKYLTVVAASRTSSLLPLHWTCQLLY
jgi:hypothetical protein